MRKDLKIGLAIGAVLLVVLIVYLAVPKTDEQLAQNPADAAGAYDAGGEVSSAGNEQADNTAPPSVAAESSTDDAGYPFDEKSANTAVADAGTSAKDGEGTNWARILEFGELPEKTITPQLRAVTPPSNDSLTAPRGADAGERTDSPAPADQDTPDGDATAAGAYDADPRSVRVTRQTTESEDSADASETTATGARTHTIRPGEDYTKIAKMVYGDGRHYLAIMKANPTLDPTRLRPGTVINLPDPAEVTGGSSADANSDRGAGSSEPVDSEDTYVVKPGDSLYKIAVKRYGSSNMVDDIYELNRQTIGEDSSRLKVGMVLKLPPNPNADEPSIR